MKMVIEVSDTLMEYIVKGRDLSEEQNDEMALAIADGTPLPEHHGRLVDVDKLIRDTIKNPVHAPYIHIIDMKEAPTIIEGSDTE